MADYSYFIVVRCLRGPCEYSFAVHQTASYIQLTDGFPQYVEYRTKMDQTRLFQFNLPPGESEVIFTLNPNTYGFTPVLYAHQYNHTDLDD